MKNANKKRWAVLAFGTATLLFAGIIYAWSVIKSPFVGIAGAKGWGGNLLTLNYTLTMCFFCIGGFLSGLTAKKLSMRLRMIVAGICAATGFTLTTMIELWGLFALYVGYGFLTGLGIGIVYNVVIGFVNSLFPDHKGLCSGILMMGFGFSTLTLGKIMTAVMDISPGNWKTAYIGYGLVLFAVFVLFSFAVPGKQSKTGVATGNGDAAGYTAGEMIKTGTFWKLFVFFILFAAVGSTAISGAKDQFAAQGISAETAVLLAGVLTVCNGIGRVVSGLVFDKLHLRKTQYVTSLVVIAATLLTFLGYRFELSTLGCVGLCLCGFSYGFSPTLSAAFVMAFFGSKNFQLNFSILNLILIPASFVPTLLGGLSYEVLFIVLAGFSLVGFALNLTIKDSKSKVTT